MTILDALTHFYFRTTEDGRMLFFPYGAIWRGFLVPSSEEFERLRRRVKARILGGYAMFLIVVLLTSSKYVLVAWLLFIFYIFYSWLWMLAQRRGLKKTNEVVPIDWTKPLIIAQVQFVILLLASMTIVGWVGDRVF
jgi:hypothetical protein